MDAFDLITHYQQLLRTLPASPKTWLITGVAGLIGSNLLEALIKLDQRVVGLDNFVTVSFVPVIFVTVWLTSAKR